MKKFTTSLVICMLMLGTAACTANTETEEPPAEHQELTAEHKDEISHMTAPIDAVVRCMLENNMTYDPQDPEFFWTSLAYFVGAYGQNHTLAELSDDAVTLPKKAVQEHAIALFADYDDLLPLPESLSSRVTYDESMEAYSFSLGDIGLARTELTNERMENGVLTVQADLVSTMDGEIIGSWDITLTENTYADSIADPIYLYSISSVTPLTTENDTESPSSTEEISVTAVFNGLSDGHTAEMTLEDGSVAAFQFTDPDVAAKLDALETGDTLTFTYTQENPDSAMTITSVK